MSEVILGGAQAQTEATRQSGWRPIKTAPWQTVIEVRNSLMSRPVLATRGYSYYGMVHPDSTFCTSVFTPDPDGFFPTPAGQMVCPDEWRPALRKAEGGE